MPRECLTELAPFAFGWFVFLTMTVANNVRIIIGSILDRMFFGKGE